MDTRSRKRDKCTNPRVAQQTRATRKKSNNTPRKAPSRKQKAKPRTRANPKTRDLTQLTGRRKTRQTAVNNRRTTAGRAQSRPLVIDRLSSESSTDSDSSQTDQPDPMLTSESDDPDLSDSLFDEEVPLRAQQGLRLPGAMPLVPRTDHLDDSMRRKIRKGKFVLLKKLLGNRKKTGRGKTTPSPSEDSDEDNLPISLWVDAFIVLISVHIEFFPCDIQGMLRHMQIVKKMASQGKDGVEYDTQFRRLKAQHAYIQWGEYLPELAADVDGAAKRHFRFRKPYNRGFQRVNRASQRVRVCHILNSTEGCKTENCNFPHKCRRCLSGNYPLFRCTRE